MSSLQPDTNTDLPRPPSQKTNAETGMNRERAWVPKQQVWHLNIFQECGRLQNLLLEGEDGGKKSQCITGTSHSKDYKLQKLALSPCPGFQSGACSLHAENRIWAQVSACCCVRSCTGPGSSWPPAKPEYMLYCFYSEMKVELLIYCRKNIRVPIFT